MTRAHSLGTILLSGAIGLLASGCGGGEKEVKVTGSVVQDGKPQDGANVSFTPADPKQISKGARTNEEGKFQITIKPGSYAVALTRFVDKKGKVPKESEDPTEDYTQLEASGYLRQVFPAKYGNPSTSGIKVDIPPEGKDLPPFEVEK